MVTSTLSLSTEPINNPSSEGLNQAQISQISDIKSDKDHQQNNRLQEWMTRKVGRDETVSIGLEMHHRSDSETTLIPKIASTTTPATTPITTASTSQLQTTYATQSNQSTNLSTMLQESRNIMEVIQGPFSPEEDLLEQPQNEIEKQERSTLKNIHNTEKFRDLPVTPSSNFFPIKKIDINANNKVQDFEKSTFLKNASKISSVLENRDHLTNAQQSDHKMALEQRSMRNNHEFIPSKPSDIKFQFFN